MVLFYNLGVPGDHNTLFLSVWPNGSLFISILLHNSKFRILNSEFRSLHCEFRNSEFGIVKYYSSEEREQIINTRISLILSTGVISDSIRKNRTFKKINIASMTLKG